jgi:hypothetical protein
MEQAINHFIFTKKYNFELHPKDYSLITDTTNNCQKKWPEARILPIASNIKIILLWRADKNTKFECFNSNIVKLSLNLIPLVKPFCMQEVSNPIKEIDLNDIELLQYKMFSFL